MQGIFFTRLPKSPSQAPWPRSFVATFESYRHCPAARRLSMGGGASAAAGDAAPTAAAGGALPRLGEALPHIRDSGCIYLDYNATTPIFPEVGADFLRECSTAGIPADHEVTSCLPSAALPRLRILQDHLLPLVGPPRWHPQVAHLFRLCLHATSRWRRWRKRCAPS